MTEMTESLMAVILMSEARLLKEPPEASSKTEWGANVLSGGYESNWSRRYKTNLERLASGEVTQVVQVVRDLKEQDARRGLSAGEKRMLAKARLILLQEG